MRETQSIIAKNLNYLILEEFENLSGNTSEISKILNAIITKLQSNPKP
ncbi:hypothetical protein [Chryseobacterium sp. W4I1]